MSVLSRQTIQRFCTSEQMVRRLDGKPLKYEPVSIDIHLSEAVVARKTVTDLLLAPGQFCLATTIETFKMPDYIVGFVIGKSTLAREGLQIEAAGLIDPGFEGDITLELKNLENYRTLSYKKGDPIGQVWFMYTDEPVDFPYGPENGNHYQGQQGVTPSYRDAGKY